VRLGVKFEIFMEVCIENIKLWFSEKPDQLEAGLCINDRALKLIPLFVWVVIYQGREKGLNAEFVC
jgi:hypothetical protein